MECEPNDKIKYYKERRGDLSFMLTWQSLDGRLQTLYYGTETEAVEHAKYLKSLGRQPKVWLEVYE